jgi:hypothetical protein
MSARASIIELYRPAGNRGAIWITLGTTSPHRSEHRRMPYPDWHAGAQKVWRSSLSRALSVAALGPELQIPRLRAARSARDDTRGGAALRRCGVRGARRCHPERAQRVEGSALRPPRNDLSTGGLNLRAPYANLPTSACLYSRTVVEHLRRAAPHSLGKPTVSGYRVRWYAVRQLAVDS